MPRILHVSDLHFGTPSVPEQVRALEEMVAHERFRAIVISGDLSQRTRTREFEQARDLIARLEKAAPVLTVPGNHDTAWWNAPGGVGSVQSMYSRYRTFINKNLEPVLHVPGISIVGLNSSHGIQPFTLTTRPRDLSVVGALQPSQWAAAKAEFAASPAGDLKVLVFHHNLLRGRLSNRWGLANRAAGIAEAAATGADVVLCGHDHQERIEQVRVGDRSIVVSTANTLTTRVRGGLPASFNVVNAADGSIYVTPWEWSATQQLFIAGVEQCYRP
jgi:3',5'-cyclic AMP phosphodiesterase CpdA